MNSKSKLTKACHAENAKTTYKLQCNIDKQVKAIQYKCVFSVYYVYINMMCMQNLHVTHKQHNPRPLLVL